MDGEVEDKIGNKGFEEKTWISNILRELINLGFGKNKKVIKKNDLKKIKSNHNISDIYKLSFELEEDKVNLKNEDNDSEIWLYILNY